MYVHVVYAMLKAIYIGIGMGFATHKLLVWDLGLRSYTSSVSILISVER